jgi:hypothetical protein
MLAYITPPSVTKKKSFRTITPGAFFAWSLQNKLACFTSAKYQPIPAVANETKGKWS